VEGDVSYPAVGMLIFASCPAVPSHPMTLNKTSQAAPVSALLLFLSQWPGAPEFILSHSLRERIWVIFLL
jgi:hypothetical protein